MLELVKMRGLYKSIFACVCLSIGTISSLWSQNSLVIDVHGVPASKGKISIAIYDSAEDFLKFDKAVTSRSAEAHQGITRLSIDNLPKGEYAVAVFYDANGNDELDTNWLGVPKEKVAFSKAKMRTFGPPKYKDCCFKVYADTEISIAL